MNKYLKYMAAALPILLILGGVLFFLADSDVKEFNITGIAETTEIDIASKIPGRISFIFFSEGSTVKKGDTIAIMESPEIYAKLEQARGAMNAAKAKSEMAEKGARDEEKEVASKLYNQAKYQFELADKTWQRISNLYRDSVISAQEKDQAEFKYRAAKAQLEEAQAKVKMINLGARIEEKSAAAALYHQAENAFNEVSSYQKELTITAPAGGEISKKLADPGEVIAAGYPVFSIMVPEDIYALIQLREDKMSSVKMNSRCEGYIPALKETVDFEVSYIAPMADFATWKPTNQKGEFDLKSFEIRLKPVKIPKGFRPGMTVNFKFRNN